MVTKCQFPTRVGQVKPGLVNVIHPNMHCAARSSRGRSVERTIKEPRGLDRVG